MLEYSVIGKHTNSEQKQEVDLKITDSHNYLIDWKGPPEVMQSNLLLKTVLILKLDHAEQGLVH